VVPTVYKAVKKLIVDATNCIVVLFVVIGIVFYAMYDSDPIKYQDFDVIAYILFGLGGLSIISAGVAVAVSSVTLYDSQVK
jgi:hypothetical protein